MPLGTFHATHVEAVQNNEAICGLLGQWDITRLANGAAIDGPGYGCEVRVSDDRGMGASVCKKLVF